MANSLAELFGAVFPLTGEVVLDVEYGPTGDEYTGTLVDGGGGVITPPDPGEGIGGGIINRMRQQIVCYWPLTGYNEFNEPEYGDIVELRVRWDDAAVQYDAPGGGQLTSKAIVYPGIDVPLESKFIELPLAQVADVSDPANNDGVFIANRVDSTPNLRNTQVLYTVYLN